MIVTLQLHRAQEEGVAEFTFQPQEYLRQDGESSIGPAPFQWSTRQLQDLRTLYIGQDEDGARLRLSQDLGELLSKLRWKADSEALDAADLSGEEVTVTMACAARELFTLPWEVLPAGEDELFLADHPCALVQHRIPSLPKVPERPAPEHPGVLFAWSDAQAPVPYAEMGAAIRAAAEAGGVSYREIPQVHAGTLQQALEQQPLSVLHLLCHGRRGRDGGPPVLAWGDGGQEPISSLQLARLLWPFREHIRLVVLSACGSGDSSQDGLFLGGLAQELHKKGIEAVVASRFLLSIPGALRLAQELYPKMLVEGWSLERSLRHARIALLRPDAQGRIHDGDAYGLQLYSHDEPEGV